jgi:hypothetical protein
MSGDIDEILETMAIENQTLLLEKIEKTE